MKNKRKGSADIVLLVILIILVCAVGGYLVWSNMSKQNNNNQNTASTSINQNEVNSTNNNVNVVNQTTNDNSSNQNTVDNTMQNISNNTNNEANTSSSIPALSEEEAKKKIERCYLLISDPFDVLKSLYGCESSEDVKKIIMVQNEYGGFSYKEQVEDYILTDISWDDFKKEVHKCMSEELFNVKNKIVKSPNKTWTKEINGKLAVGNFGMSGYGFLPDKLILKEQSQGLYIYRALGLTGHAYMQYMEARVTFKYVDGNYIIVEADNTEYETYNQVARKLFDTRLLVDNTIDEYNIEEVLVHVPNVEEKEEYKYLMDKTVLGINQRLLDEYDNVDDKIFASITYSVKPKQSYFNNWIAGDGTIEEQWVKNKTKFIVIDKLSNKIVSETK